MEILLKRAATEEEIGTLCAIAEQVWHWTYDKLLPEGQVDYMVEKFQSPQAVKEQMAKEHYEYYLICFDHQPGGFVGFAARYQGREEMFLSKVYILPQYQGQGGVRQAFKLAEDRSRQEGLSRSRLTVNKGNRHAAQVYSHYGFETVDAVTTDIGRGYVMDDFIMIKELL